MVYLEQEENTDQIPDNPQGDLDLTDDLKQALADFNKAIELNPTFARPYLGRAKVYRKIGNSILALKNYRKAIELDPNYADAYFERSKMYTDLNQIEFAFKDYRKAIELDPSLDDDLARKI